MSIEKLKSLYFLNLLMSPKKREPKEPKISLKDIEEKEINIRDFENKHKFYSGIRWGVFLGLFGNLFVLVIYDAFIKSFLTNKLIISFVLIICAIILFVILTFLKDKQIKIELEKEKEEKIVE